jgi:hypothetical protein
MPATPGWSKKSKKSHTPKSPKPAKAARAERANKRASSQPSSSTGVDMSRASVEDEIIQEAGEEGNGSGSHIEPNVIINPGGESGHAPAGAESGSTPGQSRSGSRHRQSDGSQSNLPGRHSGQCGDNSERSDRPQDGGSNESSARVPTGRGAGDDCSGTASSDHHTEARERAVMTALALMDEANDLLSLIGGYPAIRLTGQSKLDAKRLLDNIKSCVDELMRLKFPEDDETFPRLKQARRDLQRLLLEADEQEATANARAAASRAAPSAASPPPQQASPEAPQETGSGLRYTLAMRQLDCEIARLRSPRLIDVKQGADVQPDVLKDLLKVDVPDVRKSVDRARDALETLTLVAGTDDEEKILKAQDVCERAIDWIALVEGRCKAEQLYLDVKLQPREVDFVPFKPGTGVSIYEFFHKFEAWARGRMPLDQKANVLYNRHLDPSSRTATRSWKMLRRTSSR